MNVNVYGNDWAARASSSYLYVAHEGGDSKYTNRHHNYFQVLCPQCYAVLCLPPKLQCCAIIRNVRNKTFPHFRLLNRLL